MASRSPGTRRWRRRGALLLCILAPAGCRPPPPAAGNANAPATLTNRDRPADTPDESALDVRLDALFGDPQPPGDPVRNPFRLGRAAPPPVMPENGIPVGEPAESLGAVDGWRPASDPAGIRFLGVVEAPGSVGLVAALSDGGVVRHGRVNDVVGGRYRIVALDRTAVVLERVRDGERRTLRPSGY